MMHQVNRVLYKKKQYEVAGEQVADLIPPSEELLNSQKEKDIQSEIREIFNRRCPGPAEFFYSKNPKLSLLKPVSGLINSSFVRNFPYFLNKLTGRISVVAVSDQNLLQENVQEWLRGISGLKRLELTVGEKRFGRGIRPSFKERGLNCAQVIRERVWWTGERLQQPLHLKVKGQDALTLPLEFVRRCCNCVRGLDLSDWKNRASETGDIDDIVGLIESMKSPKSLNLRGSGVTDTLLKKIAGLNLLESFSFNRLEYLDLSHNGYFKGKYLSEVISESPLRELNLYNCFNLSDSDFARAIKSCTGLEKLLLNKCRQLGDDAINAISGDKLSDLNLNGCGAGERAIKSLADRCPNLITLFVKDCQGTTKESIEYLLKNCKKLKKINFTGPAITQQEVTSLQKRFVKCEIIFSE